MNKEIIYEIFTIFGWVKVPFDTYRDHKGNKRWYWNNEEHECEY